MTPYTLRNYNYADAYGAFKRYNASSCIRLPSNDSSFTFEVQQMPPEPGDDYCGYRIYLCHQGKPVGVCSLEAAGESSYTPSVYFKDEYRGRGYSAIIFNYLLNEGLTLVSQNPEEPFFQNIARKLYGKHLLLAVTSQLEILYSGEDALRETYPARTCLELVGRGVQLEHVYWGNVP